MNAIHATLCCLVLLTAPCAMAISPGDWRGDIQELALLVKHHHPDPFTRIPEADFDSQVEALAASVDSMTDTQVAVSMMALVASIRDGHTTLHPSDPVGFNHWLPLSFYWFSDGIAIVAAHKDHESLVGAKLVSIGGADAIDAASRVARLMGSDNAYGNRQNIFYLSSLDALAALGIAADGSLTLELVDRNGERKKVEVEAVTSEFVLDETRFWGEMYGPVERSILADFVMPFESLDLRSYSRMSPAEKVGLPMHARHRQAYWSTYLPDTATYYMQVNHTTSAGRGEFDSFEQFYRAAFEFANQNEVEKFILDIRYNSGGDGSILIPFVHEFVRSDKVNRKGRLFTVVGRKTYSAATMLLDLMIKHTNTVLVGEPAGSALNSYGDPRDFSLSNSGMTLNVSSEYWKLVHSSVSQRLTPIDIPAEFSSDDYFSGRDPAVDQVLDIAGSYRRLDEVLAEDGAEAALERYKTEKSKYGPLTWWRPFDESTFRKVARRLGADGRSAEAISAFNVLIDAYPDSWRAWRDFGKLYLAIERRDEARNCFRRAQQINPGDAEINDLAAALRER